MLTSVYYIRFNAGDFRRQIRYTLIGTELDFTSYIKLTTFSKYGNSRGRKAPAVTVVS